MLVRVRVRVWIDAIPHLPGQRVGEDWCRPLELLPLEVELLVLLPDLPRGGGQVLAETYLGPGGEEGWVRKGEEEKKKNLQKKSKKP